MQRLFMLPLAWLVLSAPAQAETIHVGVNGMVCAFCATGIEKTLGKEAAIESVTVDLENQRVTLETKDDETISDAAIKKRITDAGFTTTGIDRQP